MVNFFSMECVPVTSPTSTWHIEECCGSFEDGAVQLQLENGPDRPDQLVVFALVQ